jgi:beta-lactam-binding protein with PASTA domain
MPSATATLADPGYGIGTIANDDVKAAGVCRVPKVKGLTLTTAKARLTAAGCRIATTRRRASATVRKGRALGTSAKAGTLVPAGTKVAVVLSTGTSAT